MQPGKPGIDDTWNVITKQAYNFSHNAKCSLAAIWIVLLTILEYNIQNIFIADYKIIQTKYIN